MAPEQARRGSSGVPSSGGRLLWPCPGLDVGNGLAVVLHLGFFGTADGISFGWGLATSKWWRNAPERHVHADWRLESADRPRTFVGRQPLPASPRPSDVASKALA